MKLAKIASKISSKISSKIASGQDVLVQVSLNQNYSNDSKKAIDTLVKGMVQIVGPVDSDHSARMGGVFGRPFTNPWKHSGNGPEL